MERNELPTGLAMVLSMNPEAMQKFASLSEAQKQEIIEGTHAIRSRQEMHKYVNSIVNGKS